MIRTPAAFAASANRLVLSAVMRSMSPPATFGPTQILFVEDGIFERTGAPTWYQMCWRPCVNRLPAMIPARSRWMWLSRRRFWGALMPTVWAAMILAAPDL